MTGVLIRRWPCEESACNAGDPSSIPGSGRSTGEWTGYPLQYSGLENSMESDPTERLSLHFHVKTDTQGKCHVTIKDSSDYKPRYGKDFQTSHQKLWKARKDSLKISRVSMTLLIHLDVWILASGSIKVINFCCFKPPSLQCFVVVALDTTTLRESLSWKALKWQIPTVFRIYSVLRSACVL